MLDARIASALSKFIQNSYFKKKSGGTESSERRSVPSRKTDRLHDIHQKISLPICHKLKTMAKRSIDQKLRSRMFDARNERLKQGQWLRIAGITVV